MNWPDFNQSMKYSLDYVNQKTQETEWNLLINQYNTIKNSKIESQKIPKIVHQIWLGGNMRAFEKQCTSQVKQFLNESWEYKLWTEDNIHELKNFKHQSLFDSISNLGQKSDILRIAILSEIGGIYMDTDFILLKDFEDLLHLDFFCGVAYDKWPSMCNGLIGCHKDSIIINDMLEFDREVTPTRDIMTIMDMTGPYFITRKTLKNIQTEKNVVFPNSFFYPLPNFSHCQIKGKDYKNYVEEETIGVHLWSCSWF